MMRAVTLVLLLSACSRAAAIDTAAFPHLMEFRDALIAYQGGEHPPARAAFRHLAELGDPEARFNLGVMLLRGEGGPADPAEGAAWIRWAAQSGLAAAESAWPTVESSLEPEELSASEAALEGLRDQHDIARLLPESPTDGWPDSCLTQRMHRVEPRYPTEAAGQRQIGYAVLHFLISPSGQVEAVHAMPSLIRDDRFAEAATRALRRWSARDCPSEHYRYATQLVLFDLHGREEFGRATLKWANDMLTEARAGGGAQAYAVATADLMMEGLFELRSGERRDLMLQSAVAGVPDARSRLARWLHDAAPEHAARWRELAARQGHGPALFSLARNHQLPAAVRSDAMLRAARAGFLPAVVLAVRELTGHPDPTRRDGATALAISSALPERLRRDDPALAQAHAAALAELGRFPEAIRWQKRALHTTRRLGHDAEAAQARLNSYLQKRPWRDPALSADESADSLATS